MPHANPPADRGGPWRQPDFLKVLVGETICDLGSQVGSLVIPLAAALTLDATAGQMAALRAAAYLPPIAVGLAAGVWIDRLRRRPILLATNAARALLLLIVAAAAARGALTVEALFAAQVAMAALAVVFDTALSAYLPSLVPARALVAANGARATSQAATEVVGPSIGGALLQALGVPVVMAVDGLSFVASVAGIASVRAAEPAPPSVATRRRPDLELRDGWRTLTGHPVLRAFLATMLSAQLFYSVTMAVYLLYLTRDLGLSPTALGVVFGFGGGVGVLIGSAVAARVARALGMRRTLVGAHALFGLFGLPLALATLWPGAAAPLVFASELLQLGVNAVYMVGRAGVEQAVTPAHLRGRVRASMLVAHAAAGILGTLVGGLLGEQVGLGAAIWVGAVGGLFSFLWLVGQPIPDRVS